MQWEERLPAQGDRSIYCVSIRVLPEMQWEGLLRAVQERDELLFQSEFSRKCNGKRGDFFGGFSTFPVSIRVLPEMQWEAISDIADEIENLVSIRVLPEMQWEVHSGKYTYARESGFQSEFSRKCNGKPFLLNPSNPAEVVSIRVLPEMQWEEVFLIGF